MGFIVLTHCYLHPFERHSIKVYVWDVTVIKFKRFIELTAAPEEGRPTNENKRTKKKQKKNLEKIGLSHDTTNITVIPKCSGMKRNDRLYTRFRLNTLLATTNYTENSLCSIVNWYPELLYTPIAKIICRFKPQVPIHYMHISANI